MREENGCLRLKVKIEEFSFGFLLMASSLIISSRRKYWICTAECSSFPQCIFMAFYTSSLTFMRERRKHANNHNTVLSHGERLMWCRWNCFSSCAWVSCLCSSEERYFQFWEKEICDIVLKNFSQSLRPGKRWCFTVCNNTEELSDLAKL